MKEEIDRGFTGVPKGCYIQLEKKAAQRVLENISQNFRGYTELVNRIRCFKEDTGEDITFDRFLERYHYGPEDIYRKGYSFARLCVLAGIQEDFHESTEEQVSKVLYRFAAIDSRRWIQFMLDYLPRITDTGIHGMSELEQRMLRMMYMTIWDAYADDWDDETVRNNLNSLAESPTMIRELITLLQYQFDHIDFIDSSTDLGFDCPLDVHCTYSQRQLLTALDYKNFSAMRQGVLYLPEKKIDLFLITLVKSDKDYSPTTLYEDYAISRTRFHWQSQSTTSADSPTGQRYIHHRDTGNRIILFVREFKRENQTAAPYTYLGQAEYVCHNGSKPMNIVWDLERPIPAKYLRKVQQVMG